MLFSQTIDNIDNEITELLAQIEAKKQHQSQLLELDVLADHTLEELADVVDKVGHYDRNAIASLKSAVLQLFTDGGNNGGNQPTDPSPGPDDDELELLCLNGLTGECLTTTDDRELPVDDPTGDEWILSSSAPLTGQTCTIDPELYWQTTTPDGSAWNLASPLACLLEDAPLIGQSCQWASPFACVVEVSSQPIPSSTEMVHLGANVGYLRLKADGRILATYCWFARKNIAQAWLSQIEVIPAVKTELRESKRNSSWKWELKISGLSMAQIERLAAEPLHQNPRKSKETPAQAAGLEPPSGWRQPQSKEDSPQLNALVLLPESEYVGQTLPVSRVSANDIGYTVTLPNGDSRWYRADMVQIVDAEIEENALPTEPTQPEDEGVQMAQNRQEAEAYEFNDIVQVTSDKNDCVGLVGSFGRVKVIKGDRIGVEIDEQLVYFNSSELKLKVKAETPSQQQNHPPTADESISDQEATYLQTNGNYLGVAKQTRQRWEQAGINPSDLIADMKTKRPAEPLWDAAKYNPVLATVGSEYDF